MLINKQDVIRIKMPFPDISSDLATKSHMYICHNVNNNTVKFVKCQTLKPYMLTNSIMKHYWDEFPNINRNPFKHKTRIDCDKEFITYNIEYDDKLKTTIRPNVCLDTMQHIDKELLFDGYISNNINEDDLISLNPLVKKI